MAHQLLSRYAVIDFRTDSMERCMNPVGLRRNSVASNSDTPGYKTQDIDLQGSIRPALNGGTANPVGVSGLNVKNGGNNYDFISD